MSYLCFALLILDSWAQTVMSDLNRISPTFHLFGTTVMIVVMVTFYWSLVWVQAVRSTRSLGPWSEQRIGIIFGGS